MLKWRTPHPDLENLIRYSDGELPKRTADRIARHLQDCWECRSELDDTDAIVRHYMRYHKGVFQTEVPAPPNPWCNLRGELGRIANTEARNSWRPAFLRQFLTRPATLMLTAGTLCASAVIAFSVLVHAPTSEADELLRKGVIREHATSGLRRIEMRTKTYTYTRNAEVEKSSPSADNEETAKPLETLFREASYSWKKPLSAESFMEWRRHLVNKRDQVTGIRSGNVVERYEIRTITSDSTIRLATIALNASNFLAIVETLEFRNGEVITITPLAELKQPPSAPQTAKSQRSKNLESRTPTPVEQPSRNTVSDVIGPGDEIRVFVVLHHIGADLGDPIQISREDHEIVVSGGGLSNTRQKEIQQSLAPFPHVVVRFPQGQQVSLSPSAPLSAITESSDRSQLEVALESRLGSRDEAQHVIDAVLRHGDAMMARAYAIRRLAEHFPANVESAMAPADPELLTSLRDEQESALLDHVNAITDSLAPLLDAQGAEPLPEPRKSFADWQSEVQDVFAAAPNVDRLLAQLFGHATPASATAPRELRTALVRLKTHLGGHVPVRGKQ
jgi:hypothetical protein